MRDYTMIKDELISICSRFVKSVSRRKDPKLVEFSINMISKVNEYIEISELRESHHDMLIEEVTYRDTRPSKAERICKLFGINHIDDIDDQDLKFLESIYTGNYCSPKSFYDDLNSYKELMVFRSMNKDFYSETPKSREDLYLQLNQNQEKWSKQ